MDLYNISFRDVFAATVRADAAVYWRFRASCRALRAWIDTLFPNRLKTKAHFTRFVYQMIDDLRRKHQTRAAGTYLPSGLRHGNFCQIDARSYTDLTGQPYVYSAELKTAFYTAGECLTETLHDRLGTTRRVGCFEHYEPFGRISFYCATPVEYNVHNDRYEIVHGHERWMIKFVIPCNCCFRLSVTESETVDGYELWMAGHTIRYRRSWVYQLMSEPDLLIRLHYLLLYGTDRDGIKEICNSRGWKL